VLDASVNSGFYVAPIRNATTTSSLYYNPVTKEITYGVSPSGGTSLPAGTNFGDYLRWNPATSAYVVGSSNITLGCNAGQSNQGTGAVAVGALAGNTSQGQGAIAIGINAGRIEQKSQSVAIGNAAGYSNQRESIAIGQAAGYENQSTGAVAVGAFAGYSGQGAFSIAVGLFAGSSVPQISNSIILNATGVDFPNTTYQSVSGFYVAPIRNATATLSSMYYNPATNEITYGVSPSGGNVPVGTNFGDYLRWNPATSAYVVGSSTINIGTSAGAIGQSNLTVAVGWNAGLSGQQGNAVAIGAGAGNNTQQSNAVAIGEGAGASNQGSNAIAIGKGAGTFTQTTGGIAIGDEAAKFGQGANAIAIGTGAGHGLTTPQGDFSIAIGNAAGYLFQSSNSIILNATAANLNSTTTGFFVKPLRTISAGTGGFCNVVYNPTTGEFAYTS